MKWSQAHIQTLREAPSEAEIASHQLLIRANLIKKLAGGIYTFMPLGLRALRKVEKIIREEMDHAGALEVLMPALQPTEIWEQSGRLTAAKDVLFNVKDRQNRNWLLGPTHEEVITDVVASEVHSYKQLPKNFYQIQTKFRDEIRPRFGLLRAREFIMKDAYSFDVDDAGAQKSYHIMRDAYCRIFDRVGLNYKVVEADTGVIGGNFSHEFAVPAAIGESDIVFTEDGSYAASIEKARSQATVRANPDSCPALEIFSTPQVRTIEQLASAPYSVSAMDQIKTLVYLVDSKVVVILVRGDHQLNEAKLAAHLKCVEYRPALDHEIREAMGADAGSLGACKLDRTKVHRVLADEVLKGQRGLTTGANENDFHVRNVDVQRDIKVDEWVDLRTAQAGELSVEGNKPLRIERAIEVGHVFKLGTKYSSKLNARFTDEKGVEHDCFMGCYGIGVTRTLQAVIEQHHDANGIAWPLSVAPFQIILTELDPQDASVREVTEKIYQLCNAKGWEVLWDDRDERPGVKFKDADLIGIPVRVTVGAKSLKQGGVEIKRRNSSESQTLSVENVEAALQSILS